MPRKWQSRRLGANTFDLIQMCTGVGGVQKARVHWALGEIYVERRFKSSSPATAVPQTGLPILYSACLDRGTSAYAVATAALTNAQP